MNEAKSPVSRRAALKSGLALLSSLWLSRFAKASRASSVVAGISPKRIYIAPDDHTDYMWAATDVQYQQYFVDMIDYYLNLADSTDSEPNADYKSRWHCDGTFWLWTYAQNKTAADFNRLINRIRDGSFSVPLQPLCQVLGGAPAEAVLRGMYYAGQIERRYGLRFSLAYSMENQTLPYGLGALWAGAGAKYSWKGVCGCATKVTGLGNRKYEIYWWTGPDGSRLLMKWNSLVSNQSIGGYAEAYNPSAAVDYVYGDAAFKNRYTYDVIGTFGRGWDAVETLTNEFPTVARAKTNSGRRVIVSNEIDFFQDFEATYGSTLPAQACSFGNEWDLLCASMAEVSARVKRAVEKLRSAEALAALVAVQNPAFLTSRKAARDLAWIDLGLYWEHDWSGDGPVSRSQRAAWQKGLARNIETYVDTLQADAANALAGMIKKTGTSVRFYAFNPLSWSRSDVADLGYAGPTPVHVIDLDSAQEVPSQVVTLAGRRYLRILANDVPPMGYKVYEIRAGQGQTFRDAAIVNAAAGTIESDDYRLTVAPDGAITSLIDKTRSNREFAAKVGGRAINDLGTGTGAAWEAENAGPVSATIMANVTTSSPLKHISRITLIGGLNRIAIQNDINENFSDLNSWSFAFNLAAPDVWHEEVGAIAHARLVSNGGHYSDQNARYDWLTLNHFADMSAGGVGVTLSNADCYFMQLGASTPSHLDVNTPQILVLAGGQVDGAALGIQGQGGDMHFLQRFALQTHDAYEAATAMRFALEHQNPLVTGLITGGAPYPESKFSFLNLSDPNVLLWALKPADDGGAPRNLIVRLWNFSEAPARFSLQLASGPITVAQRTTHIETPLGEAPVISGSLQGSLKAHQIGTYSLTTDQPVSRLDRLPIVTQRRRR